MLEPPLEIEIFLHPAAAGIQNQAGKHQGLSIVQILFDQNLPLVGEPLGDPGVSIARQIDEVATLVDAVKINGLRSTRCITRERQLFVAGKGVNQAGLANVTSP
jgi:hypothetical protein